MAHLDRALGSVDLGTDARPQGIARGVVKPLQLELDPQLLLRMRDRLAQLELFLIVRRRLPPPLVDLRQFGAQANDLLLMRLAQPQLLASHLGVRDACLVS